MTRRDFKKQRADRKKQRASIMRAHRKLTGIKRGVLKFETILMESIR